MAALICCVSSLAVADPEADKAAAIVDRWLAAQNAGKFDDYQVLYARRFHGIRRSGDKTVKLDHDGWLRERKKMFGVPMIVTIDQRVVETTGTRTRVRFVQTFQSGKYKDNGEKEIVIAFGKIISEEMRTSTMAGADGSVCDEMRCKGTTAPEAIVTACEKACTGGDAASCREAAVIYESGECHVTRDAPRARAFYLSACGADDPMSCTSAAFGQEPAKAEPLLAKACEHGDPYGCHELAHLLLDGKLPHDGKRAVSLLAAACDEFARSGPGGMSCSELAVIYREGKVVKRDQAKAEEYAKKYTNSQAGE